MRSVGLLLFVFSVLIPSLPPVIFGVAGLVVLPLAVMTLPGMLIGLFMTLNRNSSWGRRKRRG